MRGENVCVRVRLGWERAGRRRGRRARALATGWARAASCARADAAGKHGVRAVVVAGPFGGGGRCARGRRGAPSRPPPLGWSMAPSPLLRRKCCSTVLHGDGSASSAAPRGEWPIRGAPAAPRPPGRPRASPPAPDRCCAAALRRSRRVALPLGGDRSNWQSRPPQAHLDLLLRLDGLVVGALLLSIDVVPTVLDDLAQSARRDVGKGHHVVRVAGVLQQALDRLALVGHLLVHLEHGAVAAGELDLGHPGVRARGQLPAAGKAGRAAGGACEEASRRASRLHRWPPRVAFSALHGEGAAEGVLRLQGNFCKSQQHDTFNREASRVSRPFWPLRLTRRRRAPLPWPPQAARRPPRWPPCHCWTPAGSPPQRPGPSPAAACRPPPSPPPAPAAAA